MRRIGQGLLLVGVAGGLGIAVGGGLSSVGKLALVGLVALFAAVAATLPAVALWRGGLAALLCWLMVEDLVRKMSGNALAIYFVKDVLYFVVLIGLMTDPAVRGVWRRASARTRVPLYALAAWAIAMSVPTGLSDWRLPAVGLRLDFLYAPLVVAGWMIGARAASLWRWLRGLAVLGAAACAVGLVQAVIGSGFLAPDRPTPGLGLLVTVRGLPGEAPVYRPSGTFVSSGRYASAAGITLGVALAALLLKEGRRGGSAAIAAGVLGGAGASWVSGGRIGILLAGTLVALSAIAPAWSLRKATLVRSLRIAGVGLAAVVVLAVAVPDLFTSRLAWYRETLTPGSSESEWGFRKSSYVGSTVAGIRLGGLFGQGTGSESLGKQYLYGGEDYSLQGQYQVEGGYAAVAVEWGVVGLCLWVTWTAAWLRALWCSVTRVRGTPAAGAGLVLFCWLSFFLVVWFFVGMQQFQNYLANAYFWLLSGVLLGLPAATGDEAVRADSAAAVQGR